MAEVLKGFRTTIAYVLTQLMIFGSLWADKLSQDNTETIVIATFIAYVGAKTGYKVAGVVKERMNGKKG